MSYLASVARAPAAAAVSISPPSSDGLPFAGEATAMEAVSEVVVQPAPPTPPMPPLETPAPRTPTIVDAIVPAAPAILVEREIRATTAPPSRGPSKAEADLPASVSAPLPAPRDANRRPSPAGKAAARAPADTSPVLRIDETRAVIDASSDVGEAAPADVAYGPPTNSTRVVGRTVDRPAPLETRAAPSRTAPRREPGPTQVHIGAIALTVKASPPAPTLQAPPAAPVAAAQATPAPARSREGLGFSASRHYLRWTGS